MTSKLRIKEVDPEVNNTFECFGDLEVGECFIPTAFVEAGRFEPMMKTSVTSYVDFRTGHCVGGIESGEQIYRVMAEMNWSFTVTQVTR